MCPVVALRRDPASVSVGDAAAAPAVLRLVPNPWPRTGSVRVVIPGGDRPVTILRASGRVVRHFPASRRTGGVLTWDGRDARGRPLAAGTYFLRIEAEEKSMTGKLVILP